jgi:hypothetical protein
MASSHRTILISMVRLILWGFELKWGLLVHRERMVSEDALKAWEEKPAAAIGLTSYGVPDCCSGTPH